MQRHRRLRVARPDADLLRRWVCRVCLLSRRDIWRSNTTCVQRIGGDGGIEGRSGTFVTVPEVATKSSSGIVYRVIHGSVFAIWDGKE